MNPTKKPLDDLFEAPLAINLLDYWAVLWRRRWLIVACVLAALGLSAFRTFSKTPIYTATGTLLMEREEPNILSFDQIMPSDAYSANFYKTQYRLLQSRSLAEQVVAKMGLLDAPGAGAPPAAGRFKKLLTWLAVGG